MAERTAADGARVSVLAPGDALHVGRAVRAWTGTHDRQVRREGGCRLPGGSPRPDPIEPGLMRGKRAVVERDREPTAAEFQRRSCDHYTGLPKCRPLVAATGSR